MKSSHLSAFAVFLPWLTVIASPRNEHDAIIHQLDDRRVIIERSPGIKLPEPPAPIVRSTPEPAEFEKIAEAAARWRAHRIANPSIHASATIYKLPDGRTLTRVNTWSVNNGPMVSFWSSADLSLIAHPNVFTHHTAEGEVRYTMLLFCSFHDVQKWREFAARHGREPANIKFPEFPDGPVSWFIDEAHTRVEHDAATTNAITRIHDYYRDNLAELRINSDRLARERIVRRNELEATPPQPSDIHLRISRLDPAQAVAWHRHAVAAHTGRLEAAEEKRGAE